MPIFFALEFQISHFLWLLFSVLLGLGYAAFLYPRHRRVSGVPRSLVFTLRALCVALISFLLFAPQVRSRKKTLEKPVIILAQDNSASLGMGTVDPVKGSRYRAALKKLYDQLSQEYQVDTLLLGDSVRAGFAANLADQRTDIASLFHTINSMYAGKNVGAIILASDGLYNRGADPLSAALPLKVPIYSVALGDTNQKKDRLIANLSYNELVQAGNDFEVGIQVEAYGIEGEKARLAVYREKELVFSKMLDIRSAEFRTYLPVILPAQRPGTVGYTVRVDSVPGEVSVSNNIRQFYVQARDIRKKVLIVADAPHPDIAALRQSFGMGGTYDVALSYVEDLQPAAIEKADLLVLYQIPSQRQSLQRLAPILKSKPALYVLGAGSDLRAFSAMQGLLDLKPASSLLELPAEVNESFPAFSLTDSLISELPKLGPLQVPFADVRFKSAHHDLLFQLAGKLKTGWPLFSFSAGSKPRIAVLGGEGIWRWRLEAVNASGSSALVDQLLAKSMQYLVADDDRRRFRVYPSQEAYTDTEPVMLNAELYNESFELLNTPDVALTLRGENKQVYSYQFSRVNNGYTLNMGTLPAGEYRYRATARQGADRLEAEGLIHVGSNQLEFQETKANHQLLYQLAKQSGAKLYSPEQLSDMYKAIRADEMVKTISYEKTRVSDIIDLKWLFGLICMLLFCEWFLRKRNGEL